jgi:hypothetical protein
MKETASPMKWKQPSRAINYDTATNQNKYFIKHKEGVHKFVDIITPQQVAAGCSFQIQHPTSANHPSCCWFPPHQQHHPTEVLSENQFYCIIPMRIILVPKFSLRRCLKVPMLSSVPRVLRQMTPSHPISQLRREILRRLQQELKHKQKQKQKQDNRS